MSGDRIYELMGARIVSIEAAADDLFVLEFEHRGTDDDAARIVVARRQVKFLDERLAPADEAKP